MALVWPRWLRYRLELGQDVLQQENTHTGSRAYPFLFVFSGCRHMFTGVEGHIPPGNGAAN